MKKGWKLVISLVLPFIASLIGSLFTSNSISTWYVNLVKPSFNPPNWIFGPVWTLLYFLMGLSLYFVWIKKYDFKTFRIFGIQLFLNTLWSILFFGLQKPLYAFIEIILLWVAILLTIISFYKIDKKAAYLLIPYILWVSFAAILNLAIFILN